MDWLLDNWKALLGSSGLVGVIGLFLKNKKGSKISQTAKDIKDSHVYQVNGDMNIGKRDPEDVEKK